MHSTYYSTISQPSIIREKKKCIYLGKSHYLNASLFHVIGNDEGTAVEKTFIHKRLKCYASQFQAFCFMQENIRLDVQLSVRHFSYGASHMNVIRRTILITEKPYSTENLIYIKVGKISSFS